MPDIDLREWWADKAFVTACLGEIDWDLWRQFPSALVIDAIALSLGIDPSLFRKSFNDSIEKRSGHRLKTHEFGEYELSEWLSEAMMFLDCHPTFSNALKKRHKIVIENISSEYGELRSLVNFGQSEKVDEHGLILHPDGLSLHAHHIDLKQFAKWVINQGWDVPDGFIGISGAGPKSEAIKPDTVDSTERKTLLKMLLGMAIDSYGYDPTASRNLATGEKRGSIAAALEHAGVPVDPDTVRKWLKEASIQNPDAKPRNM